MIHQLSFPQSIMNAPKQLMKNNNKALLYVYFSCYSFCCIGNFAVCVIAASIADYKSAKITFC